MDHECLPYELTHFAVYIADDANIYGRRIVCIRFCNGDKGNDDDYDSDDIRADYDDYDVLSDYDILSVTKALCN